MVNHTNNMVRQADKHYGEADRQANTMVRQTLDRHYVDVYKPTDKHNGESHKHYGEADRQTLW